MTHFRRMAVAAAVFALTLGGALAATTGPAAAAGAVPIAVPITAPAPGPSVGTMAAPSNCANSSMCGYVNANFQSGGGYEINPVRSNGTCENVTFNDAWSSIHNGSGKTVRFFAQANCAGTTSSSFTLANGSGAQYMTISHPTFTDEISSYRWGG